MSAFRFKRFSIQNSLSAMKVNTDGVLLGAACTLLPSARRILDAGTGTGLIAMMAAQRLSDLCPDALFSIVGVEKDPPSAEEARLNFASSPWKENLSLVEGSFHQVEGKFDAILSNPPFFENSLGNPDKRKNDSRHVEGAFSCGQLSYRSLMDWASEGHLTEGGTLSIIIPAAQEKEATRYAGSLSFHPFRIISVHPTESKAPHRVILEFRFLPLDQAKEDPIMESLTLMERGKNTESYRTLVQDFLLWA